MFSQRFVLTFSLLHVWSWTDTLLFTNNKPDPIRITPPYFLFLMTIIWCSVGIFVSLYQSREGGAISQSDKATLMCFNFFQTQIHKDYTGESLSMFRKGISGVNVQEYGCECGQRVWWWCLFVWWCGVLFWRESHVYSFTFAQFQPLGTQTNSIISSLFESKIKYS